MVNRCSQLHQCPVTASKADALVSAHRHQKAQNDTLTSAHQADARSTSLGEEADAERNPAQAANRLAGIRKSLPVSISTIHGICRLQPRIFEAPEKRTETRQPELDPIEMYYNDTLMNGLHIDR